MRTYAIDTVEGRVYAYICHHAATHNGEFPTYRQIQDALGLNTVSTMGDHLLNLSRAGLVQHSRKPGGNRQYSIVGLRVVLPDCAKDAAAQWAAMEEHDDHAEV